MATILEFDKVLGLGLDKIKKISSKIPNEIEELRKQREELRQQKNGQKLTKYEKK